MLVIVPLFSKIVVLIELSFSNFIVGLSWFVKSIEALPKDSLVLVIPSLSKSISILSTIPSWSESVGHKLTTILFDKKLRLEHSKTPSNLYDPTWVGLNVVSVFPVGSKSPNSFSFNHLILSKFLILSAVKIILDSPFCFIQDPNTSSSTSYTISGGVANPE